MCDEQVCVTKNDHFLKLCPGGRLDPSVSNEKGSFSYVTFLDQRRSVGALSSSQVQMFSPEMHLGSTILGPPLVGRHRA